MNKKYCEGFYWNRYATMEDNPSLTVTDFIKRSIVDDWLNKEEDQLESIKDNDASLVADRVLINAPSALISEQNLSEFLRIIIQMRPKITQSNVIIMCFKSFCFN
jgi:hypothetical protein